MASEKCISSEYYLRAYGCSVKMAEIDSNRQDNRKLTSSTSYEVELKVSALVGFSDWTVWFKTILPKYGLTRRCICPYR
jgi:trans-2-enoyl-CoA reductase